MKPAKKILLGLSLLSILFVFLFQLSAKASAASATDFHLRFGDSNGSTIIGRYQSGKESTFKKVQGGGAQHYLFQTSDDNSICKSAALEVDVVDITQAAKDGTTKVSPYQNYFRYRETASGSCQTYTGNLSVAAFGGGGTPAPAPKIKIDWTDAKGVLDVTGKNLEVTFSDKSKFTFVDSDPSDTEINFRPPQSLGGKIGGVNITGWCQSTLNTANTDMGITLTTYKDTTANVKICYNPPNDVNDTATLTVNTSAYAAPTNPEVQGRNACVFGTNSDGWDSALSWILCPVVNGLSDAADGITDFVEGQLNFDVNANLNGSVERAWSIFRELTSAILVIVMLVMVLSQAIGGGPFDAYTVRKLLPRLAAAIILMQLSWYLCIYSIGLANAAGQGVASLMAAPFGGTASLDLASLLHRLGGAWAAAIGVGTTAGIITTAIFLGPLLAFGWPILVLAVILIFIALIVFLATLLFRNALIVLLVILSPLAFLAFVLPGTDKYWKYWKDNFVKLLVFFPLAMSIIYAGRIFAWTVGNLGKPGPLDAIMVLAGFFGPYFFLPKAFKWGGTLLATASKGLNESWPIKKGREVASTQLKERQQSNINTYGKANLNPKGDPDYFKYRGLKKFAGIPYGISKDGKLGHTILTNVASGRLIPTRRQLGVAIARQDEHSSKEDAIEEAIAKRGRDKATGSKRDIMAGKEMSMDMVAEGLALAYEAQKNGELYSRLRGERMAKAGIRDLIRSRSFYELAKRKIKDPSDGQMRYIWETDMWRNTVAPDGELYSITSQERPDWVPHRLPTGLPKYRGEDVAPDWADKMRVSLQKKGMSPAEIDDRIRDRAVEFELMQSGDERAQQAEALSDVMGETDARKLATVNPVMFERIGDMAEEGASLQTEIDRATSANDLRLAHRLRVKQQMLMKPSVLFRGMVERLVETGNEYQLSQIMGGEDAEELVDHALEFTDTRGTGKTLVEIINRSRARPRGRSNGSGDNTSGGGTGDGDIGGGTGGGSTGGGTGGGYTPRGGSTTSAPVTFRPSGAQAGLSGPVELKIDHKELAETIAEASRAGSKLGVTQAFREHQPGDVFRPNVPNSDDDKDDDNK